MYGSIWSRFGCMAVYGQVLVEQPAVTTIIVMLNAHDSRSKVWFSNFSLGVSQLTHVLYDFSILLCSVTQGNHGIHKLGARFAQVFPCMCGLSEYNHISISDFTVYIDFTIKDFLRLPQRSRSFLGYNVTMKMDLLNFA